MQPRDPQSVYSGLTAAKAHLEHSVALVDLAATLFREIDAPAGYHAAKSTLTAAEKIAVKKAIQAMLHAADTLGKGAVSPVGKPIMAFLNGDE